MKERGIEGGRRERKGQWKEGKERQTGFIREISIHGVDDKQKGKGGNERKKKKMRKVEAGV